jgi:hypothetical protein
MLAGQIGARGRICTRTGDVLDVVSLHWTTRAKMMEPPAGDAPAGFLYKRNPQAAAWRRLASLTGFAPVISCLRGRRVGWTTPQGQKMVRASGNAPEPGTDLVRCGV